jgi:hypothetical protein
MGRTQRLDSGCPTFIDGVIHNCTITDAQCTLLENAPEKLGLYGAVWRKLWRKVAN